jgi:hypothetical protein
MTKGASMKRVATLTVLTALLALPLTAAAQVFYVYPDAPPVETRHLDGGGYLAFGENELVRLSGYGRTGVARWVDVGAEFLLDNVDGDWMGGIGGDVKLALFPRRTFPFDVSANTGIGYVSGSGRSVLQLPIGGVVSSPFELENGAEFVPYLGVYVLFVDTDVEQAGGAKVSDTDVDVEARFGARYTVGEQMSLFATLQLGRQSSFYVGLNSGLYRW